MLLSLMEWCTEAEISSKGKEDYLQAILLLDMNLSLNPGLFRYVYCSTLRCRKSNVISETVSTNQFRH